MAVNTVEVGQFSRSSHASPQKKKITQKIKKKKKKKEINISQKVLEAQQRCVGLLTLFHSNT